MQPDLPVYSSVTPEWEHTATAFYRCGIDDILDDRPDPLATYAQVNGSYIAREIAS